MMKMTMMTNLKMGQILPTQISQTRRTLLLCQIHIDIFNLFHHRPINLNIRFTDLARLLERPVPINIDMSVDSIKDIWSSEYM